MAQPVFSKNDLIATMRCRPGVPLPCKLDWPLRRIRYFGGDPCDSRPPGATRWQDAWGVEWQKESPDPAMMPFPVRHPLDVTVSDLAAGRMPDPGEPGWFTDLVHTRANTETLLVAEHPFALFERAWLLTGMQALLETMADRPERVDELFDRIGAFECALADRYTTLGVEAAWISDDYGMNASLMFSPRMWRRFVRPHLKRLIDRYHQAGALVVLHSCGNITPLIDDFLELGIDVLDPIQPQCNDLETIRSRTAGRLCLCGGVEASLLLADDTAATARQTRRQIERLGRDGGYIVGPDDEWDYPSAAREAMLDVVRPYRDARLSDE